MFGIRKFQQISCTAFALQKSCCQVRRMSSSSVEHNVAMSTVLKAFDIPEDGKLSRHTFEKYAMHMRKELEQIDTQEAFFTYAAFMYIADAYGLTKYPEHGGMTRTIEELMTTLKEMPFDKLERHYNPFSRALFRAIDSNRDGYISREEWIDYLKLKKFYESDEEALQSFDSLDKNKDGKLSMEEYQDAMLEFWKTSGSSDGVQDFYGTKNYPM